MACSNAVWCRGFQLQHGDGNNVPTVQGVLEKTLGKIRQESRETIRMQCSGRTDAGVHAKGQVRHPLSLILGAVPSSPFSAMQTIVHASDSTSPCSISFQSCRPQTPCDAKRAGVLQGMVYSTQATPCMAFCLGKLTSL